MGAEGPRVRPDGAETTRAEGRDPQSQTDREPRVPTAEDSTAGGAETQEPNAPRAGGLEPRAPAAEDSTAARALGRL